MGLIAILLMSNKNKRTPSIHKKIETTPNTEKKKREIEKKITREPVIEEDFLEEHPYINKNTMV